MKVGDGRQREGEAGVVLVGADASLTEHDVRVAAVEDVLGGEQELVEGRAHAALQQGGLARVSHGLQELVVLHVAGADLQDVGVLGDHRDVFGRHDLGDDRQTRLLPGHGQHLQARFLMALEAVRAGSGLERPASEARRAPDLELLREAHDLLLALDRARPRDHGHAVPPHDEVTGPDHRALVLQLRGGPLVRRHDREDFFDPLARLQNFDEPRTLLADRGDDRLVRPLDDLGCHPQGRDVRDHVPDLVGRRVRFHDNDHGIPPPLRRGLSLDGCDTPRRVRRTNPLKAFGPGATPAP